MCRLCGKQNRGAALYQVNRTVLAKLQECLHVQDPGNLEADLQAGGSAGYALLWLFFVCTIMVMLLARVLKELTHLTALDEQLLQWYDMLYSIAISAHTPSLYAALFRYHCL